MKDISNGIARARVAFSSFEGPFFSAAGVLAFSLSFTATRAALAGMGPFAVSLGRASVAGVLALVWLAWRRAPLPEARTLPGLGAVVAGAVVGSPLLSALSLREVSASHGAVVMGLAPTLTALLATPRSGERPSPRFWLASLAGTLATVGFGVVRAHGALGAADLLLLLSVALVAVGYAEGGRLAKSMGGPTVICWALVLALPVTLPGSLAAYAYEARAAQLSASVLAGFAYVSVASMFLGFFAWYRGLAVFGVARASQLQLVQGPLGALWAHFLLGDALTWAHALTSLVVLSCAVLASRSRIAPSPAPRRVALATP